MFERFLKRPPVEPVPEPTKPYGKTVISPLAVVDRKAVIGPGCVIGPFCTVGPDVTLGAGCKLISHVVITNHTTAGAENTFHPHCVIGGAPQDKKYRGEKSRLDIGARNVLREAVTIHIGTTGGGGVTVVGDDNLLMVNTHLGHDCRVGHRCVMANNIMLAGHVCVGNNVVLSGGVASHHYVTFGDYAYAAGMARINQDVPPFCKVSDRDKIRALNTEGMRRSGVSPQDMAEIKKAAGRLIFHREATLDAVLAEYESIADLNPRVRELVEFLRHKANGKHGRHLEGLRTRKVADVGPTPIDTAESMPSARSA